MTAKAPAGLGPRGRRLWRALTAGFEFEPGELVVLAECCATADLCDRLAIQLADADLVMAGSRGQPALNPLASELRMQRDLLGRLLARLSLPDADAGSFAAAVLARRATASRFRSRKG
jgi:hypothetical protein